ncbi:FAD:protein FMN transferase [Colwellia sp. KU-HH00111]|uniref:FAD:protein FMN transferase n=1 Tax=Colwellia sp. KU-HH00111 TaxID=3127652 RepID=UPI003103B7C1
MNKKRKVTLSKNDDSYGIHFNAMASPCEILVQTQDKSLVQALANIISAEVWRIEDKYSRYDPHSMCSAINSNAGKQVVIDEETYLLLNFATQCYQLSDGLFDLSSGILRKVWSFNGDILDSSQFPSPDTIRAVMPYLGWHKIRFDRHSITLAKGMEIDFGGIGKEYAVDRAILLTKQYTTVPVLVNLGGDLAVTSPRQNDAYWQVAIEHPGLSNKLISEHAPDMIVSLKTGALATSGDAKRYIINNGLRYGHILNAKTGWPIVNAPRSITVAAPQCIQAGILATLALLKEENAEHFLTQQAIKYWARR